MVIRQQRVLTGILVALGLAAGVAACNSGSSTTPAATAPTSQSTSVAVPTSGTASLPAAGTESATITFSGAPSGVTLQVTDSTTAPSGAPAPSFVRRGTMAVSGATPFFYIDFTVGGTSLPSSDITQLTVTTPSSAPSGAVYCVEFDSMGSTPAKLGSVQGTAANGVVTFTTGSGGTGTGYCGSSINNNNPTLAAGSTYLVQFYYIPASDLPTSTPSSSSSSTPSPSASPSSSSSSTPSPSPSGTCTSECSSPLPLYGFSGVSSVAAMTVNQVPSPMTFSSDAPISSATMQFPAPSPTAASSARSRPRNSKRNRPLRAVVG